ncbi:MAG: DUF371 domain-containing protein [Nanoarchaeota archaeon]|nr:DUF371 domain-containing protein [Nanoarchaeota archaeon]
MRFSFYGHPNIKADHKTTLEITKDADVTERGDCIIGVKADIDTSLLRGLTGKRELVLKVNGMEDRIEFEANPGFNDAEELVIRKSDFLCNRTLGINADKAACDLMIREALKDPEQEIEAAIDEKTA